MKYLRTITKTNTFYSWCLEVITAPIMQMDAEEKMQLELSKCLSS